MSCINIFCFSSCLWRVLKYFTVSDSFCNRICISKNFWFFSWIAVWNQTRNTLIARSKSTLIVIMIFKYKDKWTCMQMVARTRAINPDSRGIIFRKRVFLSEESSLVFFFFMYCDMYWSIEKYNNLLGIVKVITFWKYVWLL